MSLRYKLILLLLVSTLLTFAQGDKDFSAQYDELLSAQFKPSETGAVALVAKNGEVIYKKAFGMANLELNVPMTTDMVFKIGSVTKQFTAVAILQLLEQGKLNLQDDITKYIPDYPTKGSKITIEHLLTHTSGIKSYTGMTDFGKMMPNNMTPLELIQIIKTQPVDFAPGTKFKYNNSGYFILGYIIEKITGMPYGKYIEDHVFKLADMSTSYYGDNDRIIKNRAAGYDPGPKGLGNAILLSMTLPYAAGSLMSTVGDLYKWNQALFSYKIIKKESLDKALKPYVLSTGKATKYGYGLILDSLQGSPIILHGGGINGFLSYANYLPAEKVLVVVLSNSTAKSPDEIGKKISAIAIGKPIADKAEKFENKKPPVEINVPDATLLTYVGEYQLAPGFSLVITKDGSRLFAQATGQGKNEIFAESDNMFYLKVVTAKVEFTKDDKGKISKLFLYQGGKKVEGKKI
ncbi:CubicO group peptidase, beta-lactamase class C family [Pedobacter sp. ok626]|uniref:serine hydrolase n=1 Tax=Pedobacter sp. ok626 TaxID=1761882 RepID=UPI0008842CA3|nr:serine hydrolase [Pedobacter sp. ok626]SDJ06421.1 CubicO group peptidase, beta-lactamase class C family [Pedobacter sp. ok626]